MARPTSAFSFGTIGALAALLLPLLTFADDTQWLKVRQLEAEALHELARSEQPGDQQQRVWALLTQAELALNRSINDVGLSLNEAQTHIKPGSPEAVFAQALRCQLDHRQGKAGAAELCRQLEVSADSQLVTAFVHTTLAYFYYREGDHDQFLEQSYKTLELAEPLNDHSLLAAGNNYVGLYFSTRLLPRLSVTHLEAAWRHAEQMPTPEFKAVVLLNLASSYTYLGRGREALDMLLSVADSPVVQIYPTRRLVVQSMISQARASIGEANQAEPDLRGVMDELEDVVLPDAMTFGHTGLGLVLLAQARPAEALASFDKVLEITGRSFDDGLEHTRISLMAVPYASALRQLGRTDEALELLQSVVDFVPSDQPDQLLVDAYNELAATLEDTGDSAAASAARRESARLDTLLWDASFEYQIARLNASLENDRRKMELERAQEREAVLKEMADREKTLRRQTWMIGAMLIAVLLLYHSRRLQKKMADTERAASERLESLVQTRTQELEDEMAERMSVEVDRRRLIEKLSEGEKMRALGQLTAGVAHDFNNLMAVVTLTADYLKAMEAGGPQDETSEVTVAELLDHIVAAADTGAKITDGLLAYARKQPLEPQILQLDKLLTDSLPLFRNTLGERIALESDLEPCTVLIDQGQLTTSLLNLILNAREAMPDGGRVTLKLQEADGHADVVVTDTGTGMVEQVRSRAVEPFYTTKEIGEGTGLGLSMVYGFARQSGGDLSIESEPGIGTSIRLSLPLTEQLATTPSTNVPGDSEIYRGMRVLVVEDRELLLRMLQRTLNQLGMSVVVAGNGAEAMAVVEEKGLPDLLVTDMVMPGALDGPALAHQLKAQKPDLAVLLISGYTESTETGLQFLRKPFSISDLEQGIIAALGDVHGPVPATA